MNNALKVRSGWCGIFLWEGDWWTYDEVNHKRCTGCKCTCHEGGQPWLVPVRMERQQAPRTPATSVATTPGGRRRGRRRGSASTSQGSASGTRRQRTA